MKKMMTAWAVGVMLMAAPLAVADQEHHHGLMISDAWSRVTTPTAKVGGGYVTIANHGSYDDRLIAVRSDHSGKAEIHTMTMKDDVMIMRPLDDGLVIAAGSVVQLAPGGEHLMFMQLNQPHVVDEPFDVTLVFERAGEKVVRFEVLSMRNSMDRMDKTKKDHAHGDHDGHGDHSTGHNH